MRQGLAALAAIGAVLAGCARTPAPAPQANTAVRRVGRQPDGSIIASSAQVLTPAGRVVALGSPVRAKAVAVNPAPGSHSAAVLMMGAAAPVAVVDTASGAVLQRFVPPRGDKKAAAAGSFTGIAYSADGRRLLFSQDSGFVSVAAVDPARGTLLPMGEVPLPPPPGIDLFEHGHSANPGGVASVDAGLAVVALNAANTLGFVDLGRHRVVAQVRVGNAPNRVLVRDGLAYVSNEGGREARPGDFTNLSDGTPIVADPTDGFATTGTVSVVDLRRRRVVATIKVGLHPAGMTIADGLLYVANSHDDTLSVIDLRRRAVTRTIRVGVPGGAFGAGADDVAVVAGVAYVTLGQANAVAVVDLAGGTVKGLIPTLYFPTTIGFDPAGRQLVVSDDKGTGTQGSLGHAVGLTGFNSHQDGGAVNLIDLPDDRALARMTRQVMDNNLWHAAGGAQAQARAAPVAVPLRPGERSLIKHVFLVIKENRTYDQILGDVKQGDGDRSLAVFAHASVNQHALVRRFPLLDNFYDPSRQSADGHPWIVESGSFYSNDILSPDWIRSYPGGNDNDALTYIQPGFLWSQAERAGLSVKLYGEWSDDSVVAVNPATGRKYSWADYFNTHLYLASGGRQGRNIVPPTADSERSAVPSAARILDPHYPSFNLTIPDQYRMDYYLPILQRQDAAGAVPALTILWLPDDHTAGTMPGLPLPVNYQADNDLALGRLVEAISHSRAWRSAAIFVEEDDAQNGVDHVDGHRSIAYVISPYAAPPVAGFGRVVHTLYTQENINRTIENILGLAPLTQFDRFAAPMADVFTDTPDFTPFTHVAANTALNIGPGGVPIKGTGPAALAAQPSPFELAWQRATSRAMAGRLTDADRVDPRLLNHDIWYSATGFSRPYPGEAALLWPAEVIAGR